MQLTEKQAKTKWCPFARTIIEWDTGNFDSHDQPLTDTVIANRLYCSDERDPADTTINSHQFNCMASTCMAWRWSDSEKISGYCGLSGKIY